MTDFPERFLDMDTVLIRTPDGGHQSFNVLEARSHKGQVILELAGVDTREAVDALRNRYVEVPQDQVVELPEGVYYLFQLMGLQVVTVDGAFVGIIEDVIQTGANDVYVVSSQRQPRQEVLIPAISQVVKTIDLEEGSVIIDPLPGLLQDEPKGS